jgi:hypothetical protein
MISRRRLDDGKSEAHMGDSYFKVNYLQQPEGSNPWENPPIELIGKAKKVDAWRLAKPLSAVLPMRNDGTEVFTPDVPQSPVISNDPEEDVTLIPYGCTRIRVTYFPVTSISQSKAH